MKPDAETQDAIHKLHVMVQEAGDAAEMFVQEARAVTPESIEKALQAFSKLNMPEEIIEHVLDQLMHGCNRVSLMCSITALACSNLQDQEDVETQKRLRDNVDDVLSRSTIPEKMQAMWMDVRPPFEL